MCEDSGCHLSSPETATNGWVYIEIYCFYLYLVSAVFYIVYHQLVEGIIMRNEQEHLSDMEKTIKDFIVYAQSNLVWFAFNFVLVFMPVICIAILNPIAENLDIDNKN